MALRRDTIHHGVPQGCTRLSCPQRLFIRWPQRIFHMQECGAGRVAPVIRLHPPPATAREEDAYRLATRPPGPLDDLLEQRSKVRGALV
jgi:hypothetical protein